jgi:hypothetical protein
METLNREDIERQIIDLYFNQKKTYREIQIIVRKSSRDIKAILTKADPGRSSLSVSSEAYKLFSEGKRPSEVAITLDIIEPKATQFYREYWRLNQLYELDNIYEETRGNFSSLVQLYRQTKTAGMDVAHVVTLLGMANSDIQSIEHRCKELRRQAASLEAGNRNAARTLEQLSCAISETQKILDHYESLCKQQRSEMNKLLHQKTQLEEFIEVFKNSNAEYVKVKENIKREVGDTLTNSKRLIQLALSSVIESSRKDTSKLQLLCYQMSTDIMPMGPSHLLTPSYGGRNLSISNMNEIPFQDYNDPTEAFRNFVVEEAERLYDKLVDDSLNKVGNIPFVELPIVKRSDIKNSPSNEKTAFTYRKEEEERIFIEHGIGNEDNAKD